MSMAGKINWALFHNIIDGELTNTIETRAAINPATAEPNDSVPVSTQEDVDRAVAAAQAAFRPWANTPTSERQRAVVDFAEALRAEKENFVKLLVKEQGQPIRSCSYEIDHAIKTLITMASFALEPEEISNEDGQQILVRYVPIGVSVGIVPWNAPMVLSCGKIAPALLAGNTLIIKPSPFAPGILLKLVELAQQFFPKGVLQALSGNDNLGPWLTSHPGVQKISFTGSIATGKKVMESAAKTLKRVTLELGGNDPAIVLDDVDVEQAAAKIATFAFLNAGQICIAIKRIYVHEKIFDAFRDAIGNFTRSLKLGEGNEPGVFLGPVQNFTQYERVKEFFSEIKAEEQKVIVGGVNPESRGYFITPTIVENPKEDSRIVVEEPFGPIVPLLKFSTEDEVIKRANNTTMGLGASVWSRNVKRAKELALKLEAGSVWVNNHFALDPRAPCGGHKESGLGVEFGTHGLKGWCNIQTLYLET